MHTNSTDPIVMKRPMLFIMASMGSVTDVGLFVVIVVSVVGFIGVEVATGVGVRNDEGKEDGMVVATGVGERNAVEGVEENVTGGLDA